MLFCAGVAAYVFGVCLGVPRLLFGMSGLLAIQQDIVWYSGVPIVLGLSLSLLDVLVFFNRKRLGTPLRMAPLTNRGVTVALTASSATTAKTRLMRTQLRQAQSPITSLHPDMVGASSAA
jgi:hypothetical protein